MNINVDGSVTFSVAEWFEYRHEIAQISERVTSAEELAAFLGRFTRGDPPPAPLADVDLINEMSGEVAAELDALAISTLSIEGETLCSTIETYASLCFDQGAADDQTAFDLAREVGTNRQQIETTIREWDATRAAAGQLAQSVRAWWDATDEDDAATAERAMITALDAYDALGASLRRVL